MSKHEFSGRSQQSESAPIAVTADRPRKRRSRRVLLLVVVLAIAVAGGYAFTKAPSMFDRDRDSAAEKPAPDRDGDGLLNEVEESGWLTQDGKKYVTDPDSPDTDGDGLTDGDEAGEIVANAAAPAAANARSGDVYVGFSDPLAPDTDGDGLGDADEADLTLDPVNRDTDGDGLEDAYELEVVGSAPDTLDTDGDGFDDGYEDENRESRGLDPLWVDVEVSKLSYATDFAIGSLAGDAWRKDSFAWLAGNLASSGSSSIPVVGWVVGPLTDVRDAVASAIRGDWVGSGFSALGVVPYAGDSVAIPGKAAEFVARNPELAAAVAAAIVTISKVPEKVKVGAAKKIWREWDVLTAAGASEKSLLQLQQGRTNLDRVATAVKGSTPIYAPGAKFFEWRVGEAHLADVLRRNAAEVSTQVRASTAGCLVVCNSKVRIFDVVADGLAHEAKVGHVAWTEFTRNQIREDAWLVKQGAIKDAHWHFFASSDSNTIGADERVFAMLDDHNIPYTIHLPASP